jgi:hypothetical protein
MFESEVNRVSLVVEWLLAPLSRHYSDPLLSVLRVKAAKISVRDEYFKRYLLKCRHFLVSLLSPQEKSAD